MSLLSFWKKPVVCNLQISFYNEDTDYGTHGYLIAANKQRGIHQPGRVRFVFKGMSRPPALTEEVLAMLFAEARNKGFVVHSLDSYGMVVHTRQPRDISSVISEQRKLAENGNYNRQEQYQTHSADAPKEPVAV